VAEKVASTTGSDASQSVQRSPASAKGAVINGRPVAQPALPLVSLPKSAPKPPVPQSPRQEAKGQGSAQAGDEHVEGAAAAVTDETAEKEVPASAPVPKPAPSSWANLFAKPVASPVKPSAAATGTDGASVVNGHDTESSSDGPTATFPKSNASNVADAIRSYKVNATENIGYIEPRGLINTGNMCYMNSVSLTLR
jgi:ubiquitin carboxyl-terminal hydrolase 10